MELLEVVNSQVAEMIPVVAVLLVETTRAAEANFAVLTPSLAQFPLVVQMILFLNWTLWL